MRISVVISSVRPDGLCQTLRALRLQRHADFEVIVVEGPAHVACEGLNVEQFGCIRRVRCDERVLGRSRNLGIARAGGEVVAFIDDDAIPDPGWLADLVRAYEDDAVAGVGGLVFDHTGIEARYEYCDRLGQTSQHHRPPAPLAFEAGADPFAYLKGTNMSFRKLALLEVGGFDENFVYLYDDADISVRLIDMGRRLVHLDRACVQHRTLPNASRNAERVDRDPFAIAEGRTYFALKHAHSPGEVPRSTENLRDDLCRPVEEAVEAGLAPSEQLRWFRGRVEDGIHSAKQRIRVATSSPVIDGARKAFDPFPLQAAGHARLRICVLPDGRSDAAPIARALAQAGHDVRLLEHAVRWSAVEFDGELWTHAVGVQDHFLPEVSGTPGAIELFAQVAEYQELQRLRRHAEVDVVLAPLSDGRYMLGAPSGGNPLAGELSQLERVPAEGLRGAICTAHARCEDLSSATLLEFLHHEDSAAQAVAALLDSASFPLDISACLIEVWAKPAQDFTDAVFRAVLGRQADERAKSAWLGHIAGGHSRHDLVEELLGSDEAARRGLTPHTLAQFRSRLAGWAPVVLSEAWDLPAAEFVRTAYLWTLGREPDARSGRHAVNQLESGAPRFDLVRALVTSAEARARLAPEIVLEGLRRTR